MFDTYKCHLLFDLLIDHTWNIKMDALTSFIVVIIAITIQFSLYAMKKVTGTFRTKLFDRKKFEKN